jgi:hypothetical protein
MSKSFARPLAAAAVASFAIAGPGAGAASATGDHDGYDGYDVTIPLTERVSDELTDGANGIAATGAATKDVHDGQVVLSFPVRDGDERRHARTGDNGDDGDHAWRLAGGIAFTGAGPDVTWTRLKVGGDRGVVSALVGGDRVAVLRFADRDWHRTGDHGDHDGAWLELTAAGAASLNKAADGAPFEAGDAFAGGRDCR